MSPDTPAAVVESATLPAQRVVVGDLADIGDRIEGLGGPAVLVVGQVVARANPGRESGGANAEHTPGLASGVRQGASA